MRRFSGLLGGRGDSGRQDEHALDVPAHRYQLPLALYPLESSQTELPDPHRGLDDAEDWFRSAFAQRVLRPPLGCLEPMKHASQSIGVLRQGRRAAMSLGPVCMVNLAIHGDERHELEALTGLNVDNAEVAGVGEQRRPCTQPGGYRLQLLKHRLELAPVAAGVDQTRTKDQMRLDVH